MVLRDKLIKNSKDTQNKSFILIEINNLLPMFQ